MPLIPTFRSCERRHGRWSGFLCVFQRPRSFLSVAPGRRLCYDFVPMKQNGTARSRFVAAMVTAAAVALLGLTLRSSGLAPASYDWLHRLCVSSSPLTNSPVVVVYLDLDSYLRQGQNPDQPWPRELHAALLRRLTAAGARAVVFDVVFSGAATNEQNDIAFADALRANGHAVLAAELNESSHMPGESTWAKTYRLELPYEPLRAAAAGWGLAFFHIDPDFSVREYFPGFLAANEPSLTWKTAELLHLPAAGLASSNETRWVRYYGPSLTVPHVSYSSALRAGDVPDEVFRGKVVFIGARPIVQAFKERRDEIRSPFGTWQSDLLFMPAVEVHATEMINLMRGDWLRRLSRPAETGVIVGVALVFGFGLFWLRPAPASCVAVVGAGASLLAAGMAFQRGLWFPWLIVGAAQIPAALASSIVFHSLEWYRTRRSMEAAKRAADAKIREQAALIDKAHDAIIVQDLGSRVLYANPSAERLYGWSIAELQADGAAATISEPDAAKTADARSTVMANGDWSGELRQRTRGGQIIVVDTRWTLIRDERNQPSALLMIGSDVTEKKQLEAQFLRAQRLESIGSIAGGMAHDLNNALSPVLLGTQLLRRKAADEESSRILGLMESSTQRGADMVRQVLLFARGKEGDFEQVNAGAIIKDIVKMARDTFPKDIAIESFVPPDLHPVRGNVTQLHQVLLNLCVNARDAMPSGGRISLVADNAELSPEEAAQASAASGTHFVSISVSDTGAGMPPEVLARIFQPFFTTKAEGKGTGLGLATVQRIVKGHGGFLRIESKVGEGTTFEVLLPRAPDMRPERVAVNGVEARGHGELILVIDDERAIRDLLSEGLVAQGYRVITAADGLEGLHLFRKHAAEVRVVVTDSAMPVMDGAQAIAEIRKLDQGLPVVIATAESGPTPPDANTVAIRKPFALQDITTAIAGLIAKNAKPVRA